LLLQPCGKTFSVPVIFNAENEKVPYATPGENIKIPLKSGIKDTDVGRGCMVTNKKESCVIVK
jgi:hypothetical protein